MPEERKDSCDSFFVWERPYHLLRTDWASEQNYVVLCWKDWFTSVVVKKESSFKGKSTWWTEECLHQRCLAAHKQTFITFYESNISISLTGSFNSKYAWIFIGIVSRNAVLILGRCFVRFLWSMALLVLTARLYSIFKETWN